MSKHYTKDKFQRDLDKIARKRIKQHDKMEKKHPEEVSGGWIEVHFHPYGVVRSAVEKAKKNRFTTFCKEVQHWIDNDGSGSSDAFDMAETAVEKAMEEAGWELAA